jgi:hypothetical protein
VCVSYARNKVVTRWKQENIAVYQGVDTRWLFPTGEISRLIIDSEAANSLNSNYIWYLYHVPI